MRERFPDQAYFLFGFGGGGIVFFTVLCDFTKSSLRTLPPEGFAGRLLSLVLVG